MNINEPRHGGWFTIPGLTKSRRKETRTGSLKSNRLPFLNWVPDNLRNHFVAMSGEFAGTTLFLFFAFSGTQVALLSNDGTSPSEIGQKSDPSQLLYISLCFGFSLAVNAWVFFRISGGLFNPAVSLAMALIGALPYVRAVLLTIAQILGGITAAAICSALFPGPLTVRTSLGGGTSVVQGLFIEMFLTAELVFTIIMLAAEKHKGTFIAPVGIGLSLFVAELTGVYFTGGSVNPARSFGPSVVAHTFHAYHWIYWVGPILGALLAAGFYKFIKMLEYETANPGQDDSRPEGEHFNPDLDHSNPRVSFAPDEYAMEEGRVPGTASSVGSTWKDGNRINTPHANFSNGNGNRKVNGVVYGGGSGNGVGNSNITDGALANIGPPREYGTTPRPYSESPAPPNANDQFAGLAEGGMHGDEFRRAEGESRTSRENLAHRSAMKVGATSLGMNGRPGTGNSVSSNTYHNRQMAGREQL